MDLKSIIEETVATDFKDILLKYNKWEKVSSQIASEKDAGNTILPEKKCIFAAFNYFNMKDTKVVIIGQDCYHTPGVPTGLAFSTYPQNRTPPSLVNIYKEIKRDYPSYEIPSNGDLTKWARQGVLLFNMALTVNARKAASHSAYWSDFAGYIIRTISSECTGVVFLLWGNNARNKRFMIDSEDHLVLQAGHPSPLSVKHFENCGHFKATNDYLVTLGKEPIVW
jgi:uracil-DNA glycosylase